MYTVSNCAVLDDYNKIKRFSVETVRNRAIIMMSVIVLLLTIDSVMIKIIPF